VNNVQRKVLTVLKHANLSMEKNAQIHLYKTVIINNYTLWYKVTVTLTADI